MLNEAPVYFPILQCYKQFWIRFFRRRYQNWWHRWPSSQFWPTRRTVENTRMIDFHMENSCTRKVFLTAKYGLIQVPLWVLEFGQESVSDSDMDPPLSGHKLERYRPKHIFIWKRSEWNSSGKASHYVGFDCVSFLGRISLETPGS